MKLALVVVAAVLACASAAWARPPTDMPPGCDSSNAISDDTFKLLMSNLTSAFSSFDREDLLKAFLTSNHATFTAHQTRDVLELFPNSLVAEDVVGFMSPYIMGISCKDARTILNEFSSELDALDVLKILAPLIQDIPSHNATILTYFNNTFNEQDAEKILAKAVPRSCVWGDVSEYKTMAFVVDTSGSMSTQFMGPNGNYVTRLEFVAENLITVAEKELQSYQSFNVIHFAYSASAWAKSVQPVTKANVESAVTYIEGLVADGSTSMLEGLQLAFSDPNVEAIFLLTDGVPNGSTQAIIDAATAWAGSDKHINAIAFMAGAPPTPGAAAFMQELAEACNGVYRSIE